MRKIPFEKIGLTLYEDVAPSGLKVIVAPVKDAETAYCGLYVDYGAFKHESAIGGTKIPYGVAHFLEHSLFHTAKGDANTMMERLGAYANALTAYSYTLYYYQTTKDIYGPLDILLSMTTSLTFTEEDVEREKKIILSELSMYENNPLECLLTQLKDNIYANSPLKFDVLGTRESIKEIHQSTLRKVFGVNYTIDNMTLICTGRVDPDELMAYLSKVRFALQPCRDKAVPLTYAEKPNAVVREFSTSHFPTESTKVAVGLKLPPRKEMYERYGMDLFILYELVPVLLFSRSSRAIDDIMKSHLALSVETYDLVQGGEDAMLYCVFMTERADELIERLKEYFDQAPKAYDGHVLTAIRKGFIGPKIADCGEPDELFFDLVDHYADHIAAPTLVESAKLLYGRQVKKFLKDVATWPRSFAVMRKKGL